MIRVIAISLCVVNSFLSMNCEAQVEQARSTKPNIVLIVADDLGFSDLGCYGSEIETPELDLLAKGGIRFSQFYNTGRCWPTRAAILTGYYAQQVRRDTVDGIVSGVQGVRPSWAKLLPQFLKQAGYRSYHCGKWHVDGLPLENGFDRSYSLNDHDRHFNPNQHTKDDFALAAIEPSQSYYSSTAIADHAIEFIRHHESTHSSDPFFEFVAFTAPHFPLQAPAQDVAHYLKTYRPGWDAMRTQRSDRLKLLGLGMPLSLIDRTLGPPRDLPEAMTKLGPREVNRPYDWTTITSEQREFQSEKMAVHAAMVHRMDIEIGRIVSVLKEANQFENTLIVFLSDNGASAEILVRGDGHDPAAQCGTAATFLCLGPGWSSFCNTPFRKHKSWVHEGGICTPCIFHWPRGKLQLNTWNDTPCHVIDLLPSFLDIAAADEVLRSKEYSQGPNREGIRLRPVLQRVSESESKERQLWWQHEKNRAIRVGPWKLVASGTQADWELYNLESDRTEMNNLARSMPDKVQELSKLWTDKLEEFSRDARSELPN